jgi:hypothetical protein
VVGLIKLDAQVLDLADDDPGPVGVVLNDGVAILPHANTCSHSRSLWATLSGYVAPAEEQDASVLGDGAEGRGARSAAVRGFAVALR